MTSNYRNKTTRGIGATAAATLLFALGACGTADEEEGQEQGSAYGDEGFEFIIPYGQGGSSDPVGRQFASMLAEELGVSETVTNLPGGETTIGISQVVNSDPDGRTLGLASTAGPMIQPYLNPDLDFDTDDIDVLATLTEGPNALFVSGDSPHESLQDLIDHARERPGEIRVGSPVAVGSTSFVPSELEIEEDIELDIIPFSDGSGEVALATMRGDIEAASVTAAGQLGLVESGDLRPLAYTGPEEYGENLSGAESFESLGYDLPFSADYMAIMPNDIPDDVRAELVEAAQTVIHSDEWEEWTRENAYLPRQMEPDEADEWYEETREAQINAVENLEERDDS